MSISMEMFAAEATYPTFDPFARAGGRVAMFTLNCRSCGHSPDDQVVAPTRCPKCNGSRWERTTTPGSLLANARRN